MTKHLSTIGLLVGAMLAGALSSGCGTNNSGVLTGTGGSAGAGGSTQGTGGSTASGGSSASGGITTGFGGIASGGIASGGIGSGGVGSGGVTSGGIASGGVGSGGIASGGIASGGISSGGIGSGGIGSGGVASGGVAFGGARDAGGTSPGGCPAGQMWCEGCTPGTGSCADICPSLVCPGADAGCIGGTCALDARPSDATAQSCTLITTQTECDGRSDCHSVFESANNCGCSAPGCCTHFSRCADGAHANCSGTASCKIATPYCETPYVLAYTNNCYEGCVQQSACAPATCPQTPPPSASACGGGSVTCFYQDCAGTGLRTLAVCSGYAWTEQTAACGPVTCSAGGQTDDCAVGDACVTTTSGGGAYWEDRDGDGLPGWMPVNDARLYNAPRRVRADVSVRW